MKINQRKILYLKPLFLFASSYWMQVYQITLSTLFIIKCCWAVIHYFVCDFDIKAH